MNFLRSQPADRAIVSHHSWKLCAVGDYAREVLIHDIPDPSTFKPTSFAVVWDDPVLLAMYTETGTSYDELHIRHPFVPKSTKPTVMDVLAYVDSEKTYGQLLKSIDEWTATGTINGEEVVC